jgi:PAS domain S-box-containing protein
LESIDRVPPDIILLDVRMPGIDGFELASLLKERQDTQEIPIIFMTVLDDMTDKMRGFELGAVDYITKPIQVEEVSARINTHLKILELQNGLKEKNALLEIEIAEHRKTETALSESEKRYRNLVELSPNGIAVLVDDEVVFANKAMAKLHIVNSPSDLIGKRLFENIDPEFSNKIAEQDNDGSGGLIPKRHETYKLFYPNGEIFALETIWSPLIYDGAPAKQVVVNDVTERMNSEELMKKSLEEKNALLKEIHHRVKNNFAVISSLLNLQIRSERDHRLREILEEISLRINCMGMVHEKLHQSESLQELRIREYLNSLIDNHLEAMRPEIGKHIRVQKSIEEVSLGVRKAISLGFITTELLSNCYKHAFPNGKSGEIQIGLNSLGENSFRLYVEDNGIGISEAMDIENAHSMGLKLINLFADQIGGELEISSNHNGTIFAISFSKS